MTIEQGPPNFSGELREVQFAGDSLKRGTSEAFKELRDRSNVSSILVLTRATQFVETVEDWLAEEEAAKSNVHVTVQSLTQHASRIQTSDAEGRRVATRTQQLAALVAEANSADWSGTPFLERASQQDSFLSDLSRLVTSILTQDIRPEDVEDEDLRAIVAFAYDVKDRLEEADLTDLSRVIHVANRGLENGADISLPDAILVLNFEEFVAREREYVARISEDRELVCVSQQASSVYRITEEPGDPSSVPGLTRREEPIESFLQSQSEAVAARLATGESHAAGDLPGPGSMGSVVQLECETFETQLRSIADEIHRLQGSARRGDAEIGYGDIAVAVRDTRAPIADVVQTLWNQNIPVTSTTVNGLEYDTAARELYHVLRAIVAVRGGGEIPTDVRETLETRIRDMETDIEPSHFVDDQIEAAANQPRFDDALSAWIGGTELKGRIAREHNEIQARISFDNVEEVVRLARFVEENDLCTTWEGFLELVEVFYERNTSDQLSDELDTSTTGVRVDTVRSLKGDRRKAVFVVGVVEDEFPSDVPTTPLFPEARAREINEFPLLVTPDDADVRETFPTAEGEFYDPLRAYYRSMDRRLLGIAAQTAKRHLYFGTYRQDRSGLAQYRPSRFLDVVDEEIDVEVKHGDDRAKSPGRSVVATFDESRRELWEATMEGPVDAEDLRSRFQTVQYILDAQDDDRIREALRTRVELSRGEVRRPSTGDLGAASAESEVEQ